MDYKKAGVDQEKGDSLVKIIEKKVRGMYGDRVVAGVGGFGGLYKIDDNRYLAASADGVGSKVLLAIELNIHNTVGIDLVAMNINDILCTGATPLFFMDYLALNKIDLTTSSSIIEGIVEGCRQSECPLLGGETAQMPDIYREGEYDLAGFAIGQLRVDQVMGGSKITPGQSIIGLASSGMHSNGYSLIRKLLQKGEGQLGRELLTPTPYLLASGKKTNE